MLTGVHGGLAVAEEAFFEEIKRYVGFGPADEAALHKLRPLVVPHRLAIAHRFYQHIERHPSAGAVLDGPEQTARLKVTLQRWVVECFEGPWGDAYYARRSCIGRRHVEINLDQRYMLTGMSVVRDHIFELVIASGFEDLSLLRSVDKLLDMELAIMLESYREENEAKLRRSERLAAYGEVMAAVAHELRNPLSVMDSSLYLLSRTASDDSLQRHVDSLREQVDYSSATIQSLLDLVRGRKPHTEALDLGVLVKNIVDGVECRATLTYFCEDKLPVIRADSDHVSRALLNLVTNSIQAMADDGTIEVRVTAEHGHVVIVVNDDGPGIAPPVAASLFEPLVTTKAQGVSLGLSLARRLIEDLGGRLVLTEGSLPGAAFAIYLPVAQS